MEPQSKFTIIYSFKIFDGRENDFINSWEGMTKLIYEFEGSYGSRLHKINDNLFIGYAQWPDKETYDKSGNNLPEGATGFRQQMRECCSEIKAEYESNLIVKDLLKNERHSNYR